MFLAAAGRSPELGIRMAMGATPTSLATQVLRQAAVRVAIALPLGWMVAWAGRQGIQKMLYGVTPDDPAVFSRPAWLSRSSPVALPFAPPGLIL